MIALVSTTSLSDPGPGAGLAALPPDSVPLPTVQASHQPDLSAWTGADQWRPRPLVETATETSRSRTLSWFRIVGLALSLIVHVGVTLLFVGASAPSGPEASGASATTDALVFELLTMPSTAAPIMLIQEKAKAAEAKPERVVPKLDLPTKPQTEPEATVQELVAITEVPLPVSEHIDAPAMAGETQPPITTTPVADSAPSPMLPATDTGDPAPEAPLNARGKRAQNQYLRALMAWLAKHRVYPTEARKEKLEGVVQVRFSLDRDGHLLAANVQRSAGSGLLDAAALAVLERANPMPPFPKSLDRQRLTVSLPIDFSLQTD